MCIWVDKKYGINTNKVISSRWEIVDKMANKICIKDLQFISYKSMRINKKNVQL